MQAAHIVDKAIAGTQMQMVGIRQFDLTADVLQIRRTQCALDRALRADVHKDRCLHRSVRTGEHAATRVTLGFQ